jgi:hypothetical protein
MWVFFVGTRVGDVAFLISARRVSEQSFGQAFSKACGVRGKALQHLTHPPLCGPPSLLAKAYRSWILRSKRLRGIDFCGKR